MTTYVFLPTTGVPKRTIVEAAFEDVGLAGYIFERTPEEISAGLRKLNILMREWPWNKLGYSLPDYGEGLPEDLSNIPDYAVHAVQMFLAKRLAPMLGKQLGKEYEAAATRSLYQVQGQIVEIPTLEPKHDTPRGQGYKERDGIYRPFFSKTQKVEEEEEAAVVTPDPGDLAGIVSGN